MTSKVNNICRNCPYYNFLYVDEKYNSVYECLHPKAEFGYKEHKRALMKGKCDLKWIDDNRGKLVKEKHNLDIFRIINL